MAGPRVRRGRTLLSLLALIACFTTVAAGLPPDASAVRQFRTGVTVTDIRPPQQVEFERVEQAGATYTRILVYWSDVAPRDEPAEWAPWDPADPAYDWAEYDRRIMLARAAGLQPLVMVYGAPRWAERCRRPTPGICSPDPRAFADFARAAATRYSGTYQMLPRVRLWQPWNEPNLAMYFQPQNTGGGPASPGRYRAMVNAFSGAVKAVDPSNLVVAAGLAPLKRPGSLAPMEFARRLLCMEGRVNPVPGCTSRVSLDIWATNPYTTGGPTHSGAGRDDVSLGDLPEMAELIAAASKARRIKAPKRKVPFWVTEFSWDSKPPDPGGLPPRVLTRWTSEAMYRSWKAGVSVFFWLSLRDWPREGLPWKQSIESGLYTRGDTVEEDRAKPVLSAFRFPFVAMKEDERTSIWGRTPGSEGGPVRVEVSKGRSWRRVATVRAARNGVFVGDLPSLPRGAKAVRAAFRGEESLGFSLKPVKDFYQPPFG